MSIMASTTVDVHTQDGNTGATPSKASEPFIPSLMKSAVDQTVKAVSTVVQTEIRALPRQIVAAVAAQQTAKSAKRSAKRRDSADDDSDQGPSRSQQLWNDAYDILQDSSATAGIVESYAETLTFAITGQEGEKPNVTSSSLAADLRDPIKRQAHMRNLVCQGREKFASDSRVAQAVGDVAGFVLQARAVVDVAIKNVPQAALPWAGVCVGLQVRRLEIVKHGRLH